MNNTFNQRKPMNRGQGFRRPERPARAPLVLLKSDRAGVYAPSSTIVKAQPKECVLHSATYEARVRQLPCARCGYRPPIGNNQFCHADQHKGMSIKTDVRRGWSGCGQHDGLPGCHYIVGTSGTLPKEERRAEEDRLAAWTRGEIRRLGLWPKRLPHWEEVPCL